jgi:hypothetical protein
MYSVSFSTDLPYDHLQRAIDTVRRMGFQLASASLRVDKDRARVLLTYDCAGSLSAATLHRRIEEMPGIADVRFDAEDRCEGRPPRPCAPGT